MMEPHDPVVCIKEMLRLAQEGKLTTIPFWLHETHLQLWVLQMFDPDLNPDGPVFGSIEADQEFNDACCELLDLLGMGDKLREHLAISEGRCLASGAWVTQLLIKLLMEWLIKSAQNGDLVELIKKLIDQLQV